MRILLRCIAMCTLIIFICTTTGCATSHHRAATSRHATQRDTETANVGKDEGPVVDESSSSNSSQVTVLIVAGVVVATVALLFIVANLAAKGIGENIGGSVA